MDNRDKVHKNAIIPNQIFTHIYIFASLFAIVSI